MFASVPVDEDAAASWQAVKDGSAQIAYCSRSVSGSACLRSDRSREIDPLAIDEAHLSEWGHDFRPDLRLSRWPSGSTGPAVMALHR